MKAIVCDRCGRVIIDEKEIKNIVRLDMCTNDVGKFGEKHLCDDCVDEFKEWFNNVEGVPNVHKV